VAGPDARRLGKIYPLHYYPILTPKKSWGVEWPKMGGLDVECGKK